MENLLNDNLVLEDGTVLDKDNTEFFNAAKLVLETDLKLIYLTGKAGTGKTTFIKYIRSEFKGNMAVLTYTGVAAVNVRGQTINSFFKIKPSVYIPNDKRLRIKAEKDDEDRSTIYNFFEYDEERKKIIKGLDLLIIDEISMVRCDLLDVIDRLLRVFRKKESISFGGVQVVLIGDVFQLPPIAKHDEWEILKLFYDSIFFFNSKIIQSIIQKNELIHIHFEKIHRQKEEKFINLLNRIRVNEVGQDDIDTVNSRYNPTFIPDSNSNYIILATHKRIVENTNLTKLNEIQSELKIFTASISGIFIDEPTDRVLKLKEGAQIMFLKNDIDKRFYNGTIAKICKLEDNNIIVDIEGKEIIIVERYKWENTVYTWNKEKSKVEEKVIGEFEQFPIRLAWAITVHKSQGLTFKKVVADLGSAFTHGHVYVALSRCETMDGLILKTKITRDRIITHNKVLEFAKTVTPDDVIIKEFERGKADKLYRKSREAFNNNLPDEMFQYIDEAVKVRDDRDTPDFINFIKHIIKAYHRYKEQLVKTNKEMQKLKEFDDIIQKEYFYFIDNLQKEQIEFNVYPDGNRSVGFCATAKYITIDWGDGKIEKTLSNGTERGFLHEYDYEYRKSIIDQDFIYKVKISSIGMTEMSDFHFGNLYPYAGHCELKFGYCPELERVDCSNLHMHFLDINSCSALSTLSCGENRLKSLEINGCTVLEKLSCGYNLLTSLDLSKCASLTMLNCFHNDLTSIDISTNSQLKFINCNNNNFTTLNLNYHRNLEVLDCSYNKLFRLDVSNCTALIELECSHNQLSAFELNSLFNSLPIRKPNDKAYINYKNNPGYDTCDKSIVESKGWIDINSKSPFVFYSMNSVKVYCDDCGFEFGFDNLYINDCFCVIEYQCQACGNTTTFHGDVFDVEYPLRHVCSCGGELSRDKPIVCPLCKSKNVKYETIYDKEFNIIYTEPPPMKTINNNLKAGQVEMKGYPDSSGIINFKAKAKKMTIDWGDGTIEKLTHDKFGSTYGIDFIKREFNHTHTYANNNYQTILLKTENLTSIKHKSGVIHELRFGDCPNLQVVYFNNNNLTVLDIMKAGAIKILCCNKNQLAELNLNGCSALEILSCESNKITKLNLNECKELGCLFCANNRLAEINVNECAALWTLDCDDNQLKELNVRYSALSVLHCKNNNLQFEKINEILESLPTYSIKIDEVKTSGYMYIYGNPGANTCNRSIATNKGWNVE